MHAKFLSFICGKCAGTDVYPHVCVKFKMSCTVLLLAKINVVDFGKTLATYAQRWILKIHNSII